MQSCCRARGLKANTRRTVQMVNHLARMGSLLDQNSNPNTATTASFIVTCSYPCHASG